MSLDLIYSGLSALIPLANDGHVPVELLTGPTQKVLISLFKTRSFDSKIVEAPIA